MALGNILPSVLNKTADLTEPIQYVNKYTGANGYCEMAAY
jgi:hypothetical protein